MLFFILNLSHSLYFVAHTEEEKGTSCKFLASVPTNDRAQSGLCLFMVKSQYAGDMSKLYTVVN